MTEKEYNKFLKMAKSVSFNDQDAEDILHNAWLGAKLNGKEMNGGYLFGSIRNQSNKIKRKFTIHNKNEKDIKEFFFNRKSNIVNNIQSLDIETIYKYLTDTQKEVFKLVIDNPEALQKDLCPKVDMTRRNFAYHLGNVQNTFDAMYFGKETERPKTKEHQVELLK